MKVAIGVQPRVGSVEPAGGHAYTRPTVDTRTVTLRTASSSVDATIDGAAVRAALVRCQVVVERHAATLTRLDSVLGDGDHGDNLVIGFRAVEASLAELPASTPPGALLRTVGHRLVAAVGGASGPLYGTAFLQAGAAAGDRAVLDRADLGALLMTAAEGLMRRGRCTVGDKTILDALHPAATALAAGASFGDAVRAARRGMLATRPLVARRGLAMRLGPRSVGHLDPGAVSCVLLLRALGGR